VVDEPNPVADCHRAFKIDPPICRRRVAFYSKDRNFTTAKMRTVPGYTPMYENEEGIIEPGPLVSRTRLGNPVISQASIMSTQSSPEKQEINKKNLSAELHESSDSALARYRKKVLGGGAGTLRLLQYELAGLACLNLGGGLGYLLRRIFFSSLFADCGKGVILGRGLMIRRPGQIKIGDQVAIDDFTLLDGGMENELAVTIGAGSIISKGCVVQAKTRPLVMGENCDIGAHVLLSSIGGIILGDAVLIAGNCYIGGGRYHTEDLARPIMDQGVYSRGPVKIGDGTWIGASATILDGVTIGTGCVVGAGALVTRDIPDYGVAVGAPARVIRYREQEKN
jgi:acetyltransferase-like isoleucine patch superfamily enzyme